MEDRDGYHLPPGRQPYDPLSGFRVGAIAGGLLGAVAVVATGSGWFLLAGAITGGAVGYVSERRKLRGRRPPGSPPGNDNT